MARMTARQKQSRKASREKAQKKFWRSFKRYTIGMTAVIALLIMGAGSWWLVDSGWIEKTSLEIHDAWHQSLAEAGFGLQEIYIQGRKKTGQENVLAAIGLKTGESIFSISLEDMRTNIEKLSTVRHATVERVLPHTLFVSLEERAPVAIWQYKGALRPIDLDGKVLDEDARAYPGLLVVVGEGAPRRIGELMELLAQHKDIAKNVTAAVWVGGRRWNLKFNGGVEVMLPDTEESDAMSKLAGMQRSQRILDKAVSTIDMRLEERTFITLPEEETISPLPLNKEGASEI